MMSEFLLERFGILKRLFLSEVEHSCFRPRNCLPKTNVSFIRTTHEILRVTRKCAGKDALHSFDVVAFSTSVLSLLEYSNCSVITCRDELSSCWRPVHVQHCICVIYMNCECRSKLDTKIKCRKKKEKTHVSNVKSIQVVVFICNCKKHGLLRIPRNSITLHIQFQLFHRLIGSYVIQNNRFIYSQSFQKCDLVENST